MKKTDAIRLPLGLYRVFWKDDKNNYSLCAIGMNSDGTRWIAPCNWVAPSTQTGNIWRMIDRLVLIEKRD